MKAKVFALITTLWLFTAFASAQTGSRRGMPNYNPNTETTLKGTVEQVMDTTGRRGWHGTHLMLNTDEGKVEVHVGPASYIAGQGFAFAKDDRLQVLGSKVKFGDTDVLIAREINKDGKTLVLRDAQGLPKWAGGRRPKS